MSEKFGEKLRNVRTVRRTPLEELAEAIGSSKAYVWQLENKKIANYFAVCPDFFLDDTKDEPSDSQLEDAFFRKFQKLSANDKRTIERIVAGFDDKDQSPAD